MAKKPSTEKPSKAGKIIQLEETRQKKLAEAQKLLEDAKKENSIKAQALFAQFQKDTASLGYALKVRNILDGNKIVSQFVLSPIN